MGTWHKYLVTSQDPVTGCFWFYWIFCLYEKFRCLCSHLIGSWWNLVRMFLSCAWIWNRRHFGFRGARSYAKIIFALILTKWAEIWYIGSLAVPEYGTDVILDFEGQEATPNSFFALILTKWAEIWYVDSFAVPEYGTDAILDLEGQEAT